VGGAAESREGKGCTRASRVSLDVTGVTQSSFNRPPDARKKERGGEGVREGRAEEGGQGGMVI
jgi:hypothetical protein